MLTLQNQIVEIRIKKINFFDQIATFHSEDVDICLYRDKILAQNGTILFDRPWLKSTAN